MWDQTSGRETINGLVLARRAIRLFHRKNAQPYARRHTNAHTHALLASHVFKVAHRHHQHRHATTTRRGVLLDDGIEHQKRAAAGPEHVLQHRLAISNQWLWRSTTAHVPGIVGHRPKDKPGAFETGVQGFVLPPERSNATGAAVSDKLAPVIKRSLRSKIKDGARERLRQDVEHKHHRVVFGVTAGAAAVQRTLQRVWKEGGGVEAV